MAIGRDIYLDSRMILRKLEELFPPSTEHPALSSKETEGMAALLNKFVVDAGVFSKAVGIMRPDRAALQDPTFVKDRQSFIGKGWSPTAAANARPENIAHVRQCFDIAESLFADGRSWVASTPGPSLADLEGVYHFCGMREKSIFADCGCEGVWAFDWIISDLEPPPEYFSETIYPKVYDWRKRFKESVKAARIRAPKPVVLKGQDAVKATLTVDSSDQTPSVDLGDPLGLEEGRLVELYPTDGGGSAPFKDQGRLWRLDKNEVAISMQAPSGEEVRIHAPRWHFRVKKTPASSML
ncbi:hypothetical protein D0865_05801 [Hortaea werneckii]|uniref:DUF7962 domain-containing protein n=1 Tax=Hortaea werneckii TaxID=91943 RepID=A0A3M7CJZ9_HORWE|nr:hypothetical protein D0865_05801 [Hortaea werneckii]